MGHPICIHVEMRDWNACGLYQPTERHVWQCRLLEGAAQFFICKCKARSCTGIWDLPNLAWTTVRTGIYTFKIYTRHYLFGGNEAAGFYFTCYFILPLKLVWGIIISTYVFLPMEKIDFNPILLISKGLFIQEKFLETIF